VQFVSFETSRDRVERAGLEFHSLGPNPFTEQQLQQLSSFGLDIPAKQQLDYNVALFNGEYATARRTEQLQVNFPVTARACVLV
jgi:hypothetical protein